MIALSPEAVQLLDFLCAARHADCRVTRLKTYALNVRARNLRELGYVIPASFEPCPVAYREWLGRKLLRETPPQPKAVTDGGGDARHAVSPSPCGRWGPGSDTKPRQLLDEVLAFCERHRISRSAFGKFVNQPDLAARLRVQKIVTQTTVDKVRAFIAADEVPEAPQTPRKASNLPSPVELESEVLAFLKRSGVSKNRMGLMVKGSPSWVGNLGRRKALGREEVDRAREIMAQRPSREEGAVERSAATSPVPSKVDLKVNRDPTEKPDTPEIDWAERERRKGARHRQAAAKRVRTEAQRALAEGKPGRNHAIRAMMAQLEREAQEQARSLDSVEQAKLVIRKRGWSCHDATVTLGSKGKGKFVVGTKLYTEEQLLELAERWAA